MRALSLYLLTLALCCFLKKGYCVTKYTYEDFKSNRDIMPLAEQYLAKTVKGIEVHKKLKNDGIDVGQTAVYNWLNKLKKEREAGGGSQNRNIIRNETIEKSIAEAKQRLYERQYAEMMQSVPAPQIAGQSSNFTSGNPGSSTGASNKGKSTNISKKNSDNWSLSSITGFVSNLFGASPQEPQFSPSMHDTSAASSYYPSNQPDDGTLQSMITPRNQKGNTSSSKGFDGTPFLPNQLQSTQRTGASNYFSPTPNTSNFTSGNPGSSAIPSQQAPMPGTSFPSFPNYPSNQSAQLNSSTIFGPSQTGTPSLDWSVGNSQNNDLYSVLNKRKSSSSKDKNATKTGKKPRK